MPKLKHPTTLPFMTSITVYDSNLSILATYPLSPPYTFPPFFFAGTYLFRGCESVLPVLPPITSVAMETSVPPC